MNIKEKIGKIFEIAKKDNWVVEYDTDLDTFYWAKEKISANTSLRKFLNDFSLYVSNNGQIEGIFIEYAKYNFVSHNKEYKKLLDSLSKSKKDDSVLVLTKTKEKTMEPLLKEMAGMIASETLSSKLDLSNIMATA